MHWECVPSPDRAIFVSAEAMREENDTKLQNVGLSWAGQTSRYHLGSSKTRLPSCCHLPFLLQPAQLRHCNSHFIVGISASHCALNNSLLYLVFEDIQLCCTGRGMDIVNLAFSGRSCCIFQLLNSFCFSSLPLLLDSVTVGFLMWITPVLLPQLGAQLKQ